MPFFENLPTKGVYIDDSTPVCKTVMDITVNLELPGMNIFFNLNEYFQNNIQNLEIWGVS